jgi:nitronate monooxygenase
MQALPGNGSGSGNAAPGPRRYRDIWSAGHSVSGIREVRSVAEVVDRLAAEYAQARAASADC